MIILLPNREWNQKQKHEKRLYQSPKTIFDGRDAIIRPHQMTDIQYGITIMGGREVSRPYWVGFSPKASGFNPFGDASDLAWEGGVKVVVWQIQASA